MLRQLLTGGSILALFLTSSLSAQARLKEPILQSQVQEAPTTPPVPDGSTTPPDTVPSPEDSTTPPDTVPSPEDSTTPPDTVPSPEDSTTPPTPDDSVTTPQSSGADTQACESKYPATPSGGGTRERLQLLEMCNQDL